MQTLYLCLWSFISWPLPTPLTSFHICPVLAKHSGLPALPWTKQASMIQISLCDQCATRMSLCDTTECLEVETNEQMLWHAVFTTYFLCHISKLLLVFNLVAEDFCQLKGSRLNHYLMAYGIKGGITARKTFVLL